MKTHKFARKPFYVDAVRVSEANIEEVAAWCEGEIKNDAEGRKHIYIKSVYRPINEKQTMAYIGDWVLKADTGFKVYVPKAFDKSFEKVKNLSRAQADEAGIKVPHEPSQSPSQFKAKKAVPTPPPAKGDARQPFEVPEVVSETAAEPDHKVEWDIDANRPMSETRALEEQATTPVKAKDEVDELFEEVMKHGADNAR
jgi:hypothetical protein